MWFGLGDSLNISDVLRIEDVVVAALSTLINLWLLIIIPLSIKSLLIAIWRWPLVFIMYISAFGYLVEVMYDLRCCLCDRVAATVAIGHLMEATGSQRVATAVAE